jgi:FlaA1/EpsC-like NDP-sugar epimerase
MTIEEAVDLVLETCHSMRGGEVNVPTLPAYRLGDLAEAMGVKYTVVGLPAHEKRHETMDGVTTSADARRMSVPELREALEML